MKVEPVDFKKTALISSCLNLSFEDNCPLWPFKSPNFATLRKRGFLYAGINKQITSLVKSYTGKKDALLCILS